MTSILASTPYRTYHPRDCDGSPIVHSFFDDATSTWTYIVADVKTSLAIIIDPVLDYDPSSAEVGANTANALVAFVHQAGYEIVRIMETHVHADHLTGAYALKTLLPGSVPICIGHKVQQVQMTLGPVYGFQKSDFFGCFDAFLRDGETFSLGELSGQVCGLPGHTPDSMGILIGDCLFAGDSIFLPDVGTARVDFPGGSASALYTSVQRVLHLAGDVRIFSGHDYPVGREKSCMSLRSEQLRDNKHVGGGITLEAFIKMREERDAHLGTPRLLHPALQINLRAGRLPIPDVDGRMFIKLPLQGALHFSG